VTLISKSRADSKSTDGRPMDQWKIHAESDDSKDVIYEFYNKLLLAKDYSQTIYASVPNGYGVTYANEDAEIAFIIEKKSTDKRTQLDITLSRIKPGYPAPAVPPAQPGPPPVEINPSAARRKPPAAPPAGGSSGETAPH
jgi:hypothetical protein